MLRQPGGSPMTNAHPSLEYKTRNLLDALNVPALRTMARESDIKGRSKLDKEGLISALIGSGCMLHGVQ